MRTQEMKTNYTRISVNLCFVVFLMSMLAPSAYAETTITVGDPDSDGGKVRWEVTANNGNKVGIIITVPANTTANGKARLLELALIAKGFNVERDGAAVKIKNSKKAEKFLDETHEKDKIAGITPKAGTIDFHLFAGSVLTGIDQDGLESQFQATLGFDGILADAFFNFGDLSGNTIDDLLTDTYNSLLTDLPIAYQSNLSLDLSNDIIGFIFPTSATIGFVENFTSDINAYTTESLATVPEPPILSLLSIGTISLVLMRRRAT